MRRHYIGGFIQPVFLLYVEAAKSPRLADTAPGLMARDDKAGTRQTASLVDTGFHETS
jgi:hypothetical protein